MWTKYAIINANYTELYDRSGVVERMFNKKKEGKQVDKLDSELNRMIVESIHNDVMEAMTVKGKIVYDMTPEDLDKLFETIAFNVKEKVAQHFKGIAPDILKGHFEAIDGSIEDAKERLKRKLGLKI